LIKILNEHVWLLIKTLKKKPICTINFNYSWYLHFAFWSDIVWLEGEVTCSWSYLYKWWLPKHTGGSLL